jgi:hypothetical protein
LLQNTPVHIDRLVRAGYVWVKPIGSFFYTWVVQLHGNSLSILFR